MYKQDKKSSIIILISSISLIALSLNQIFDFFDTINSKITSTLTILFSVLNFIFIIKLNNINKTKQNQNEF